MTNDCMVHIRISSAEKQALARVAKSAGLSLSAFLRSAAIKEAHRVLGPPRLLKDLIKKITPKNRHPEML